MQFANLSNHYKLHSTIRSAHMQPHIIMKDEWLLRLEMFKGRQDSAPIPSFLLFTDG